MLFKFHENIPEKLNDPTWSASLRGVSGSVTIIICRKSGFVNINLPANSDNFSNNDFPDVKKIGL